MVYIFPLEFIKGVNISEITRPEWRGEYTAHPGRVWKLDNAKRKI